MTKEQRQDILDLLNVEEGLSEWEINFIENLHYHFQDRDLSGKQEKFLLRLVDDFL